MASSGISQFVNLTGETIAVAGFPGDHEEIFGTLIMAPGGSGQIPWDRWFALICVIVSGGLIVWLIVTRPPLVEGPIRGAAAVSASDSESDRNMEGS